MNENEERFALALALKKCARGQHLCTIVDGETALLEAVGSRFRLKSSHFCLLLSPEELQNSFSEAEFFIPDTEEISIDPKKDEEYYSWRQ